MAENAIPGLLGKYMYVGEIGIYLTGCDKKPPLSKGGGFCEAKDGGIVIPKAKPRNLCF